MPLIICPDCGKNVSDRASTCPNCGYPIIEMQHQEKQTEAVNIGTLRKRYGGYVIWVCILSSIFILFYYINSPQREKIASRSLQQQPLALTDKQDKKPPVPTVDRHNNTDSRFIKEKDFSFFQSIIKEAGLVCRTCEGGHYIGLQEYGNVFRVYCNENSLVYKVTITGKGTAYVKPWNE